MFLSYKEPVALSLWTKYLSAETANVYLHPKTTDQSSSFFKSKTVPNPCQTKWGDISLVKATLLLLQYALRNTENTHFILLSDSCIPVYAYSDLYSKITEMKQSQLYSKKVNDNISRFVESDKLKRSHIMKQSQWMILTRDDAEFFCKHNHIKNFTQMPLTDEKYFITLLNAYGRPWSERMTTYHLWNKDYDETLEYSIRSQFPLDILRRKSNPLINDIIMNKSLNQKVRARIVARAKLSKAHPITFRYINMEVLKAARDQGSLFLRKINAKTKMTDEVINNILHH